MLTIKTIFVTLGVGVGEGRRGGGGVGKGRVEAREEG